MRSYGLKDYPQPAGGCALADPTYARRLADLVAHEGANLREIKLLRCGRRFRINGWSLVLGRSKEDNDRLEQARGADDVLISVQDSPGPTGLALAAVPHDELRIMAGICARYSDAPQGQPVKVRVRGAESMEFIEVMPPDPDMIEQWRI